MPKGKKSKPGIPERAVTPGEKQVELSSLSIGQLFSYQGKTYSKRRMASDGIRALSDKGDKLEILAPNTLVKPVK